MQLDTSKDYIRSNKTIESLQYIDNLKTEETIGP